MLILMEVYFTPSKVEMKSFIGMAYRWFKTQKRQVEAFPADESEKWKTRNEARLRALDDIRDKFHKGEAPATIEVRRQFYTSVRNVAGANPATSFARCRPFSSKLLARRR